MKLGAKYNPNLDANAGQRRRLAASGYGTPVIVTLICIGVLAAAYNHTRGNFHKIRTAVMPTVPAYIPNATGPGGQGVVELTRSATSVGAYPQFLSMTLLPGRGMDVLQITANIPAHGDIQLLFSKTVDEAAALLSDQGPAMQNGMSFGAPFLAPFAGHMSGTVADNPSLLHFMWQGHWMAFPAEGTASTHSVGSLLLARGSDSIATGLLPDGESADALFHAGSFGDGWPSQLDIKSHVDLTGQTIELTLTATNVGAGPTPVGLGWFPHFRIPSGDRSKATLSIPSSTQLVMDPRTGLPTGKVDSVAGTNLDFQHAGGKALENHSLDAYYSGLHRSAAADAPVLELADPAFGYGLRLVPVSESVTALHVVAPANQPWVALQPATNQTDPLGHQWTSNPDGSGIQILDSGQSLVLHLRLEIFALQRGSATP